jgi:peptidoglycan hydrolase-like protein with peptidoglycan-binding domain
MRLFPEYLNKGSRGPAVVVLQIILLARGYNPQIIPDGEYGEQTALGVKQLQTDLRVDQDGHFGPATRAALLKESALDVNSLTSNLFQGETVSARSEEEQDSRGRFARDLKDGRFA